jgi:predicted O-methyltransferase YrrM
VIKPGNINRFYAFARYCLTSRHARGHGIHSPFVYEFIMNVLRARENRDDLEKIDGIRSSLLRSNDQIRVNDHGTGRKGGMKETRPVSSIVKVASTRPKFGRLLFNIMNHYRPEKVLELGTSLGLGTMYLALGNPDADIFTIEGCTKCADVASKNFNQLDLMNVEVVKGKFADQLPNVLKIMERADLVFFDGDHRESATCNYFDTVLPYVRNESIFIFDDIHWSGEMERAWAHIKRHASVTVTVDLFQFGIVFFRKELMKQAFTIRY